MEENIIEKYKEYNFKEIQSGYRCKTFLINNGIEKYIYQTYTGKNKYQAIKKEYITKLIKRNIEIDEIPNIIECGENEEFSYIISQYKEGKEAEKILQTEKFNYKNFYGNLANILIKIHSVEVENNFRVDRK